MDLVVLKAELTQRQEPISCRVRTFIINGSKIQCAWFHSDPEICYNHAQSLWCEVPPSSDAV